MKVLLSRALDRLIECDSYLLDANSSERSVTHRLAVYLMEVFPDYDVDCEYNRDGFDVKRLELPQRNCVDDALDAVTVFPDIVVHRRGSNKHNLFVIEVKKSSSTISSDYDVQKLHAFRSQLAYAFAAHVTIGIANGRLVRKTLWV